MEVTYKSHHNTSIAPGLDLADDGVEPRMIKLSVITPTYNEAENISQLVDALTNVLHGLDYEIIICDDDSPDLTWARAEEVARQDSRVRVLRRTDNRGLGTSVIDGFGHASGDAVACIDADLQHDPSILPAMLKELQRGSDLVVGSRYLKGGSTSNWTRTRRWGSWLATKMAQFLLGVALRDPMSGYFMVRRDDFLRVREKLNGSGFKILLELVAQLQPTHLCEVPYIFRPRSAGASKLCRTVIIAYLRQLWRLVLLSDAFPFQFVKFALVGASGVVVNLTVMAVILLATHYRDWRISVIASLAATVSNYLLNNLWTFRDRAHHGARLANRYFSYLLASIAGLGATTITYIGLTSMACKLTRVQTASLSDVPLLFCQAAAIIAGALLNYKLNGSITWPKSAPTISCLRTRALERDIARRA